ncbi:MAG: hypothetical protein LBV17_04715 [Treponema sp.]|jgi:hypothetical protein|nr:hypothetical protein [Treponema sp.]
MAKRICLILFLSVSFVLNAQAYMVSVFIIESGLPMEGVKNDHSKQLENAFFDVFFDAGYIVSNTPMMRVPSKPKMSMEKFVESEVDEAREGGADYFIAAQIDYSGDSLTPSEISLVLFRTTPYMIIQERKVKIKAYKSEKDEIDDLKNIVKGLIPRINEH